jgi:hypothetical protein
MMQATNPPIWFWLIAGLGLLWNLVGVGAFVNEVFFLDPATLSELQRGFFENRPNWATAGYAVAVCGGVLGCCALLMRKAWALPMLLLCLAGIVIQIFHAIALGNGIEVFGLQGLILPVMVFLIACLLAWFAHYARGRGWLT